MRSPRALFAITAACLGLLGLTGAAIAAAPPTGPAVTTLRVPDGGLQPQAAVDERGVLHLVYVTGDPMHSDVQYVRSHDGGRKFGKSTRVNTHAGSALAVGTVRGPHMALAKGGRVHVAWMGSAKAKPKAAGKHAPMLYARQRDDGTFEPERNVITKYVGLDGGGSVGADAAGNVYVAWHAPGIPGGDEGTRRVFVARSADEGATFAPEQAVTDRGLGACGCCGMRVLGTAAGMVGLFRTATEQVHRDTHAFAFRPDRGQRTSVTIDPMKSGVCVMSTYALADMPGARRYVAAWETGGRIRFAAYPYGSMKGVEPQDVPGGRDNRKHPSVAVDANGHVLVAWAEDTGWEKGGSVAWQLFDPTGKAVPGATGRAEGLPAWSRPAAVAFTGGGFVVMY